MAYFNAKQWARIELYSINTYRQDHNPERAWGIFFSPRMGQWFSAYGLWDPWGLANEDGIVAKLSTRQVNWKDAADLNRATTEKRRKGYRRARSKRGFYVHDGCGWLLNLDCSPKAIIDAIHREKSPSRITSGLAALDRQDPSKPSSMADVFDQIDTTRAPAWF